jgi:hypothetical protein
MVRKKEQHVLLWWQYHVKGGYLNSIKMDAPELGYDAMAHG